MVDWGTHTKHTRTSELLVCTSTNLQTSAGMTQTRKHTNKTVDIFYPGAKPLRSTLVHDSSFLICTTTSIVQIFHFLLTKFQFPHVPCTSCNKTDTNLDQYSAYYLVKLTFLCTKTKWRPFAWMASGLQQKRCEPRSNAQKHPLLLRSRMESLNFNCPTPPPQPPCGQHRVAPGVGPGGGVGRDASKPLYCHSETRSALTWVARTCQRSHKSRSSYLVGTKACSALESGLREDTNTMQAGPEGASQTH